MMNGEDIGRRMVTAVREYVSRTITPVITGLQGLEAKLTDIRSVEAAAKEALPKLVEAQVTKQLDGLDSALQKEIAEAVAAIPVARDGSPGERGEPGRDGRDGKDGREGIDGVEGPPGRDGLDIEILPTIDEAKTYPRGTFAEYRGGVIRAVRKTDPITNGDLAKAGWRVNVNGVDSVLFTEHAEGRVMQIDVLTTSGKSYAIRSTLPAMIYREIWQPEREYRHGDVVTYSGCAWHCQVETTKAKPGAPNSTDWKLMVKSGRDGKDGKDGAPGARGQDGKAALLGRP